MGERISAYKVLIGKPQRKRLFWIPGCRWENNFKAYLTETGYEHVDWIHLSQDRVPLASSCEHLWVT
jgi:hypothetical protein